MAMATPEWVDALDDIFRAIYNETDVNTAPTAMYDKVFHVIQSNKAFEEDTGYTGIGLLEEVNELGALPYEDPDPSWTTTYVHREFKKGRIVSQKLIEDEKWHIIESLPKTLSMAKWRTYETAAADVFNYGFVAGGGGLAVFDGADGQALFSTTHTNKKGTITQTNKITTAISQSALEAANIVASKRKDSKGQIITYKFDTLLVPTELQYKARIILETTGSIGNNFNDINTMKGALNLIVWPFLTNPTAWFLLDSSAHQLNFFKRVDEDVKGPVYDFDNDAAKWKVRTRFSVGYSSWQGVFGSVGDGS
jgi:phage major head subunit gpT-like protein